MYVHEIKLRVRYGETDQMGYVYYGNYAEFYEVGRVEMLRSLGLSYKQFEADGIIMPVLELHCKYMKPAYYDEELTIRTILDKEPLSRIHFRYEVYNEQKELTTIGETTLVFVNKESGKPCKVPKALRDRVKEYF